jgi:glyoxylase-like metal-dependent hydrolase (beta-lactamase superfamily II)
VEDSGWPEALPRPGNQKLTQLPSASPWFDVYQVNAGTYAILEPRHYEEVISYLILGTKRALLLDTGMGIGNIHIEVQRLTALPVVVVNSHSHYDHVGDNHRFAGVWAFDNDMEVTRIERGLTQAECAHYLEPGSYLDLPTGFDPTTYQIRPAPVTRRLSHLETIDLGERVLTVHHTPGHSPGSLCLSDQQDGILFTGDTYYPGMLYAHLTGSDFDQYLVSLRYMVGLLQHVSCLCPAHNEASIAPDTLTRVLAAFERIAAGQAPFERQGENQVYRFEGFGVTL